MRRYIIIGLGNFGASIAEALHAQGNEVVAVDPNGAAVDRVAPFVTRAALGDGSQAAVLERIGAKDADAGVVSTGDDITASILATLALKDLNVKDVYVKVISRDHARVMERLGVTETIFPERDSALALASRVSRSGLLNYVRLGSGFSIQEMAVPGSWAGKTLRDLELRQRYGLSVIGVHDVLTDEISSAPDPDAPLTESDTLFVAGRDDDLRKVAGVK